ncbi:MAG: type II toxin-antitoxin system prevent-host-death family antitoxin [Alphaproteobacteria bacterium]|nr:type II toxin-antitoxin system prevent-host-death family antitoxin [Alphaproteobacteria bacterium]
MSRTVGAFEAKTKLSSLLDAVSKGEEIVIARNGEPVAKLVKFGVDRNATERAEIIRRIAERAKKLKLGGLSWKKLRDEGRKY